MTSGVKSFPPSFDNHCPARSNIGQYAVASSGASYNSHPVLQRGPYLQHPKMPGLLRLDSVGEVSPVKHPAEIKVGSSPNTKPSLRNCKSADSSIAFGTNGFLSKSNMVSMKSLVRSSSMNNYSGQHFASPAFLKANSFSKASQTRQNNPYIGSDGSKAFGVSHDIQKHISPISMQASPGISSCNGFFANLSSQTRRNGTSTLWAAMDTCVGSLLEGKTAPATSFSPSILSAVCTCLQPCSSSNCDEPAQSRQHSVENVPCVNNFSREQATNLDIKAEISDHVTCSSLGTAEILSQSDTNVAFNENTENAKQNLAMMSSSDCECSSQSPPNTCIKNDNYSKIDRVQKCEADCRVEDILKCRQTVSYDIPSCLSKPYTNISAPLPAPRKAGKKGRPSSKKRKKRQREKRKRNPCLSPDELSCPSQVAEEVKKGDCEPRCDEPAFSLSGEKFDHLISAETLSSGSKNSIREQSAAEKVLSKRCPIVSLYLGVKSGSDKSDEDDDDDDDGSDEDSDWSVNGDKMCTFPKGNACFNVALNLDSIFKKKSIPSLKSVLNAEDDESDTETSPCVQDSKVHQCQELVLDSSEVDHSEDNNSEVHVPVIASEHVSCAFTTGLSLDFLFSKKISLNCNLSTERVESTLEFIDGLLLGDDSQCLSSGHVSCLETMSAINAKWDESYPTAGFRTCQSLSSDEIRHPSIKVHFAQEPKLFTVHVVGTEERGGTWHLFALDRERFLRRIHDMEGIVSPVLETGHRVKILARNQLY